MTPETAGVWMFGSVGGGAIMVFVIATLEIIRQEWFC